MDKKLIIAIAVIAIAVILVFVLPLSLLSAYFVVQSPIKTEQCNMQTGFRCNDPVPQIFSATADGTVQMNLKLDNTQGMPIRVYSAVCTSGTEGDASSIPEANRLDLGTNGITIQPGTSYDFKVSSSQAIPCLVKNTTAKVKLPAGQDFRGYVVFWYTYENEVDSSLKRTVPAFVSGTIKSQ